MAGRCILYPDVDTKSANYHLSKDWRVKHQNENNAKKKRVLMISARSGQQLVSYKLLYFCLEGWSIIEWLRVPGCLLSEVCIMHLQGCDFVVCLNYLRKVLSITLDGSLLILPNSARLSRLSSVESIVRHVLKIQTCCAASRLAACCCCCCIKLPNWDPEPSPFIIACIWKFENWIEEQTGHKKRPKNIFLKLPLPAT